MKIAWLCPVSLDRLARYGLPLTRAAGGHPCTWIHNWSRALAATGTVELHVISLASRISRSHEVEADGVRFHILRDAIPGTDRGWAGLWQIDARTGFRARARKLRLFVRSLCPDLVHGHGTEDAYGLAAVGCGVPAVVSMQGIMGVYQHVNPHPRYRFAARTEARTLREGSHFFCRTDFDRSFVRQHNPAAILHHMPEPIDPLFFEVDRRSEESNRLLYVGGLAPAKGVDACLEGFLRLREQRPALHLDVVGGGSAERAAQLQRRVREAGAASAVTFHGQLDAESIANLHRQCGVFLMTSRSENSPNALVEAMCAGTPSVSFAVGGIPSVVEDGVTGLLAPPGDVPALTRQVECLLADPGLRDRLRENARRAAQVNRPERVADASLAAYRSILHTVGDPP